MCIISSKRLALVYIQLHATKKLCFTGPLLKLKTVIVTLIHLMEFTHSRWLVPKDMGSINWHLRYFTNGQAHEFSRIKGYIKWVSSNNRRVKHRLELFQTRTKQYRTVDIQNTANKLILESWDGNQSTDRAALYNEHIHEDMEYDREEELALPSGVLQSTEKIGG
jgi:hypothetical protein